MMRSVSRDLSIYNRHSMIRKSNFTIECPNILFIKYNNNKKNNIRKYKCRYILSSCFPKHMMMIIKSSSIVYGSLDLCTNFALRDL